MSRLPDRSHIPAADDDSVVAGQYLMNGFWVIVLRGELDIASADGAGEALRTAIQAHMDVVVDASRVTFAGSTFVNLLLQARRRARLQIAAPSRAVARVLRITGVDTVIPVHPTVEDATSLWT